MAKGKLIVVWNPICGRMGSSSLVVNIGTVLSWSAFRRVHITNMSEDNTMEKYIKGDIDVAYTLDHLKVLRDNINVDSIKMYATSINDKLDAIGGYQIEKGLVEGVESFSTKYLDEALEFYDYVIVDLSNKKEIKILEKADQIISILPMDKILLNQIREQEEWKYISGEKSIVVFNNLPIGLEIEVEGIEKEYNLETTCFLPSDPNIHYYTCLKNNLYSYIVEELKSRRTKDLYINQLKELVHLILMKEDEELYSMGKKRIFTRKSS